MESSNASETALPVGETLPLSDEMDAFDRLPARLREMMRYADQDFVASVALQALNIDGEDYVVAEILKLDAASRAETKQLHAGEIGR